MTAPGAKSPRQPLRVAILGGDSARRHTLRELLEAAGHVVVESDQAPDAILAEISGFRAAPEGTARPLLTARETEGLEAIADGLPNKAIALRLGISLHTVKFHLESVFRKLGARTRTEAVSKALERRREETLEF
jgi:DNA-binding NarL/FixJ family response regulator